MVGMTPSTGGKGPSDLRKRKIKGAPGGSRQTWELPTGGGDADLIIIEGSWPLPPRGRWMAHCCPLRSGTAGAIGAGRPV